MGSKKLVFVLVMFLIASLTIFAAGEAEETASQDQTEIRLAWWTNEVRTAVTLESIALYEEMNPDVKIVPEYTGWGGYWDKLATQIAANDAPDVMQMVNNRLTEYVEGGILAALDDYDLDFDKVDTAALEEWTQKGSVYGLPAGLNGWGVLYNPDIFDQAGVGYPTVDWTWDDFEAMATEIHENTGLYGVSFVLMYQDLPFLAREAGYPLFSENGKSWGFTDYSFFEDYFAMMNRMHQAGALVEHTFTMENFNNWAANPMAFGEAAMVFIPSNQATPINAGVGKALPFMPVPGTAANNTMHLAAALAFTMNSASEQPEISADLVNFLTTEPEALAIQKANRGVPATAEARNYMLDQGLEPGLAASFDFVSVAAPISSPLEWVPNPGRAEINELCDEIFAKVMFGELSPAAAAKEFYNRGNEILGR